MPLFVESQNCPMKIWVYDSLERCDSVNPPNAVGTLYADGVCRTIQTDALPNSKDYNMFPGNYRATCTETGQIRFSDSGCLSDTCTVPVGGNGVCLRDFDIAGALFSRLSPPEYAVQQERNAGTGGFFTCFKLDGSEDNPVTVTFVIFGDCSKCDPSAPTAPTQPTPAPQFGIPTAPFSFPSAPFSWVRTVPPTKQPTSQAPTTAVPSLRPTLAPSTGTPTFAPVVAGEPTRPPVTPAPVTPSPSRAPVQKAPSDDGGEVDLTVSESISVALDLSPMTAIMSENATQVFIEAATKQIKLKSSSVRSVGIVNLDQVIKEDGESLRVSFDLFLEYTGGAKALEIFLNAFGTEEARSNLLLQLVQNDDEFEMLRLIEVAGGAPTVDPIAKGDASSKALLAGSVGAVATFLILMLVVIGCIIRQRRNVTTKRNFDVQINEQGDKVMAPSSGGEKQKFTNEIVVDTEADDISTLGGSIHGGGATVGDEPTASVNLDYDFERKQYIVDGDTNTAFTSFSALSKTIPTASVFADDDGSFEQQYAEINDGASDKQKIRPFEVKVPPGLLGMVVDTPNGGVPVVRAIKPESILVGQVQIGDRLIAVDQQDVTRMTAIDVSNMISLKQNKPRILVFVRLGR